MEYNYNIYNIILLSLLSLHYLLLSSLFRRSFTCLFWETLIYAKLVFPPLLGAVT